MQIDANRNVYSSIVNSYLAIEAESALAYLHAYLRDLALIKAGASISDLNLSERRKETKSEFYPEGSSDSLFDGIAIIKVVGYMQATTSGGSIVAGGMMSAAEDMYKAYADDSIKGVLIQVNSGGGEMAAMDILHSAIRDRNKPVVAHIIFAASAGYGGVSNADEIVAMPNARVGSIGSVISVNKKALAEYAEEWLDLYASNSRKNEEFRAAVSGDFSKLQELVEEATARFQLQVSKDRALDLNSERHKEAVSGAMFFAGQAKYRGLVDSIGTLKYALKRIDALSKVYNEN
jgi:protease-4